MNKDRFSLLEMGVVVLILSVLAVILAIRMDNLSDENAALKTQLKQRTPKFGTADITSPILNEAGHISLKRLAWTDEEGKDQHFVCGEIVGDILMYDRDHNLIAAVWSDPNHPKH